MLRSKLRFKNHQDLGVDYKNYFPDFCWVLRDFEMEFKALTPMSYLEQCLETEKSYSEEYNQKNQIRALIKDYFPKLSCHALI